MPEVMWWGCCVPVLIVWFWPLGLLAVLLLAHGGSVVRHRLGRASGQALG